jgi:hypothetical protein
MRTLLIGAPAAILLGCSCPLPPQTGTESCIDANGSACLGRTAAGQPVEAKPVSFKTDSAAAEIKPTITAKTEKPPPAHPRGRVHPTMKKPRAALKAAKAEPPASRIPLPPRSVQTGPQPANHAAADAGTTRADIADPLATGSAAANSRTRTIQEQLAAATVVAERMTVATMVAAPEPNTNNTDLLVALLMAGPEIKAVSDLTGKIVAIDDSYSASSGTVRTAIAAAGAAEVQLGEGHAKPIDRLIRGEVPAAVLTLVSPEAAQNFPDIAGFRIFRISLSPRSTP